MRNIRKTLPEIAYVLVLLLLTIALFTLLGSKLFGKRYKTVSVNAKNDAIVIFVNVLLIDTLLYLTLSLIFLLWSANGFQ